MSKMSRVIDRNPQFLNMRVVESAASTFTTAEVPLPIPRLGTTRMAIELLRIFAMKENAFDGGVGDALTYGISFRAETARPAMDSGNTLLSVRIDANTTTSGKSMTIHPLVWDFTDGAGNGVMIATDNLNAWVQGVSESVAQTITFKLLYRFKRITSEEYIGIVQSQQ